VLERRLEQRRRREAVQDDAALVRDEACGGVVVSGARVDDDRLAGLAREGELGVEQPPLVVGRRVVAEVVQPRLADRNCLRVGQQLAQRVDVSRLRRRRLAKTPSSASASASALCAPASDVATATTRVTPAARARPSTSSASSPK